MQCSNCAEEAMYIYDPRGAVPTHFCGAHLPSFLQKSARAGLLKTTDHFSDVRSSALSELRPAPVPSTADAEAAVEEPTPAPRKRTRKKAVEVEAAAEEPTEEPAVEETESDEVDSGS